MGRVIASIEARMGSSRLPGKVLMEAVGKPLLLHMVERVRLSRYVDDVVIATTTNDKDDAIEAMCREHGISVFRGSEDHVLERVVQAGERFQAETCVLLTGDCPLIDPWVIDQHVAAFLAAHPHVDYVTNTEVRSYPHGLDLHVMRWETLAETLPLATIEPFREHVGWYVRRHAERYRRQDIVAPPGFSNPFFRITLDYPEDYARIKAIFEALYPANPAFSTVDVLKLAVQQGWIEA